MDTGDMSNYQSNGEFDLVEFTAAKNITYYSCCPEPYPDITFTIKLRRRPMFYVFNLILPCVLINGIGECVVCCLFCIVESFVSFTALWEVL
ncbi:Neuronal acetylcholine receptor subunit alpha-10 [Portunus trituberculatus]|uniref:Neuronal acetylcholine receptor subunit alpha-10 n=1 Tax=Portunus trituberculatus TaxID=210409 RepID=A0A5B7HC04_PORTR|nr:Neuronal acetylcholine receptor subunit alpha-10 [Portunus trituberculatus]